MIAQQWVGAIERYRILWANGKLVYFVLSMVLEILGRSSREI